VLAVFFGHTQAMELTKSKLDNCYEYLNKEDSALFDSIKDSSDPKDIQIKKLLIDKAGACRAAHCNSRY